MKTYLGTTALSVDEPAKVRLHQTSGGCVITRMRFRKELVDEDLIPYHAAGRMSRAAGRGHGGL